MPLIRKPVRGPSRPPERPKMVIPYWWPEEVYKTAKSAARGVLKRYPDVLSLEELEQEAMLYMHSHPKDIDSRLHNGRYLYKHIYERVGRVAAREAKRQAREEPLPEDWETR